MTTSKIDEYVVLLKSVDDPDIKTIFTRLADLKRYKELVDFLNKWQKRDFEKCIEAIRFVIERFQSNLQIDHIRNSGEFRTCLKELHRIESERVLEAIFEILFQFHLDNTFLETLGIAKLDQFLKKKAQIEDAVKKRFPRDLSLDQIKARVLLARRKHNEKEFFEAAKIYIDLGCRSRDAALGISLQERLEYLEGNALNECLNIRSIQLIKDIKSKTELLRFQYYLIDRIQDESDPVLKKLKSQVLTDEELLEVITTHPSFRTNLQIAEKLLLITSQY